jgi:transcription elongation factor S-II
MSSSSTSTTIESDIVSLLTRLEKEVGNDSSSSVSFAGAVEVLEELTRIPFTVGLLAKTRAGVRVSKLRDHEHAGVMTASRECIRVWKKIAEESGGIKVKVVATAVVVESAGTSVSVESAASSSASASAASASASAVVVLPVRAAATAASSSSSSSSALLSQRSLPFLPPARARVREGLGKVLQDVVSAYLISAEGIDAVSSGSLPSKESDDVAGEARVVSGAIESALFTAIGGLNDVAPSDAYAAQFRSLFFNLKRNVPLSINVFWGFVSPAIVATLTAEELATEEAKQQTEAATSAGLEAVMLDWKQKNRIAVLTAAGLSTALNGQPCKKCKSKNTDFTEKQMRSGDEPMSL